MVQRQGVDPEILCQLAERHGYHVKVLWGAGSNDGSFDAELVDPRQVERVEVQPSVPTLSARSWASYSHNPLLGALKQALVSQLCDHLQQRLPEYMVPSAVVVLEQLPLTASGKVDRKQLRALRSFTTSTSFIAPRTKAEKLIANIWAQLLNVSQVGLHDNFFELGGHSLLATRVIAHVAPLFGIKLPLRALFRYPTVEKFLFEIAQCHGSMSVVEEIAALVETVGSLSDEEVRTLMSAE